ncbi:MAG TPA: response regulator [Gemmatimonadales bacterium]|jgi:CheY-like chemotaxis protein|nr:response regulator [Gemmatimonadales bacterium]
MLCRPQNRRCPQVSSLLPHSTRFAPRGGVLIVDDEDTIRRVLSRALAAAGYDPLFEAANGAQALSLLEAHGDAVLVVLLDLMMPEVGGMEVIKHLVNVHKVPVGIIVVTGHNEMMTVEEFYSLGTNTVVASDYIVKPWVPEHLLRDVERTTAQIQAKRAHIKASAAGERQDLITARLDRIEAELRRLAPRSLITDLGLDLVRALVIAAALLAMLLLGVGDFVRRVILGH